MLLAASQLLPLSSLNFYVGVMTAAGTNQFKEIKDGAHGLSTALLP